MNAIVSSYSTSSDSEGEDSTPQNYMSESRKEPNFENLTNPPSIDVEYCNNLLHTPVNTLNVVSSAKEEVVSGSTTTFKNTFLAKDKTLPYGLNVIAVDKQTRCIKRSGSSGGSSLSSLRKNNVMPYISKAKRRKLTSNETRTTSDDFNCDAHYSVFMKAKSIPGNVDFHCHAPKKRLAQLNAHENCINTITWNPSFQNLIMSASMDSCVKIWNTEIGTPCCVDQVGSHSQAVKDVKWSIDGKNVLSGGYDKFTKITDLNTGKELSTNKHQSFVTSVVYHPLDPNLYLSGTSNDGIFAWDLRTQEIQDLAFLPNGQSFISAAEISRRNSTDKGIMVWDYKTSTILSNQVFQEAHTCTALKVHPKDKTFLAQSNAGYIALFSQKSPYKLNKYRRYEGHSVSGYQIGMDISPDGSLVASGSADGTLYVYSYHTSSIVKTLPSFNSQPCMDVAWCPTAPSLLASCDWSGQIFLHV